MYNKACRILYTISKKKPWNSTNYLCNSNVQPLVNATKDGVVLEPSAFSITLACFPSITATHENVVPRSIPITAPFTLSDL